MKESQIWKKIAFRGRAENKGTPSSQWNVRPSSARRINDEIKFIFSWWGQLKKKSEINSCQVDDYAKNIKKNFCLQIIFLVSYVGGYDIFHFKTLFN